MTRNPAIRIVTILEAYSVTGPAKAVLEFYREARRRGAEPSIEPCIVTFLRGENENAFTRAVRQEDLPLRVVSETGPTDRSVPQQLRRIAADLQPDIIWTNGVKSHFLIRASGLHRQAKWVAFHHGYTTTDFKTLLYNQLDRWSHRGAARLVTVCERFAADLSSRGIPRERIFVEHMPLRPQGPVDAETVAAARHSLDLPHDAAVIVAVGRLSKEKGHADLIQAFAELRRLSSRPSVLVIAGSGPERASLLRLCQRTGIDRHVRFPGHLDPVRPLYGLADLFVLPSHSEGSPNVLLEAMDAGAPIVATAVGGVPEMVGHEASALLVPKQDAGQMAIAMARLLQDEELRLRLIAGGRAVLSRHTPERYFSRIGGLFRQVVQSR